MVQVGLCSSAPIDNIPEEVIAIAAMTINRLPLCLLKTSFRLKTLHLHDRVDSLSVHVQHFAFLRADKWNKRYFSLSPRIAEIAVTPLESDKSRLCKLPCILAGDPRRILLQDETKKP